MQLNRTAMLMAPLAMVLLFPQRADAELSPEQYDIEGRTMQRQIADILKLGPCLRPDDRKTLLRGAQGWLGGSWRYGTNPAILKRETEIRQIVASLDSTPDCEAASTESATPPASGEPAARRASDSQGGALKHQSTEALVGALAGRHAAIEHATVVGFAAAYFMRDSADAVVVGRSAAEAMSNSPASIALGASAGRFAENSQYATIIGATAAYKMKDSPEAVVIGRSAAENISNSRSAIAVGESAGRLVANAGNAILVGASAGYQARSIEHSILLGYASGRYVSDAPYSFIAGYAAGELADASDHSVMLGKFSGYEARKSPRSIFVGRDAGMYADNAPSAVMIGLAAGRSASGSENPVFVGAGAGSAAADTKDVVLLGTRSNAQPGIENAVGIGRDANPRQSNTWHIPDPLNVGVGVDAPTAQLHTTRNVRFESMPNGVLVTDDRGNVSASDALRLALERIESLEKRIETLEKRGRR